MPYNFRNFSGVPFDMLIAWYVTGMFALVVVLPLGVIGLLAYILPRRPLPFPKQWSRGVSFATFVLPLLSGLVPLSALYLLAWRAHLNIGHWPRYMLDDPNNFQFNDPWYDRLDGLTCIADGIGWCCLYASIALTIRFSPQITMRRRIIMVCLFLVSWTVFVHEPNQLFWWRLD